MSHKIAVKVLAEAAVISALERSIFELIHVAFGSLRSSWVLIFRYLFLFVSLPEGYSQHYSLFPLRKGRKSQRDGQRNVDRETEKESTQNGNHSLLVTKCNKQHLIMSAVFSSLEAHTWGKEVMHGYEQEHCSHLGTCWLQGVLLHKE